MKHIRLTGKEQRAWNQNMPWLVNEKGTPEKPVSSALYKEASKVLQLARRKETTLETPVVVAEPQTANNQPAKKSRHEVKAVVKKTPSGGVRSWLYIDGSLVVCEREIMMARYFKKHGECFLQQVNGKFLKAIRDPNRVVKNVATLSDNSMAAPKPENCICHPWAGREAGRHHPICTYNAFAPEEEKGYLPGAERPAPALPAPPPKEAASSSYVVAQDSFVTPDNCPCQGWDGAVKGEHLPICINYEKWMRMKNNQKARYLVSLTSGQKVREASLIEIADAEVSAKKTGGFPLITIGEEVYAVLTDEEFSKTDLGAITSKEEPSPNTERAAPREEPSPEEFSFDRPALESPSPDALPQVIELPPPVGISSEDDGEGLPLASLAD